MIGPERGLSLLTRGEALCFFTKVQPVGLIATPGALPTVSRAVQPTESACRSRSQICRRR